MQQLNFTTRVLGKKASQRLKEFRVIQTIRAENGSICQAIFSGLVKPGNNIEIVLDELSVGVATYINLDPVKWHDLDIEDAHRGGFDNRFELASALKRAGYRFMPLGDYSFYRIRFSWLDRCLVALMD